METTSQRFTMLLGGGLILLFSLVAISHVGAQTCVQPPSGLVSWWPGDGNANDIQDSNPGTLQNGATFATGLVGQAFSFDGIDAFVRVSHNANLDPGSADFSVNFWMRTTFLGFGAVLNNRSSCPAPSFWDFRGAICVELAESGVGANYNAVCSSIPVNDGSWHHIALSRQGTTATLYIDGVVRGSGSTSGITNIVNTGDLLFGNNPCVQFGDGTQFYQGELDEIQYFNRALTQTEIQSIFQAGSAGQCKATPYSCTGFEPPFDVPILLKAKVNRAIPLQMQLSSDGTLITDANIAGAPPVVNVTYSAGAAPAVDVTDQLEPMGQSSEGNVFTFDPVAGQWVFHLGTKSFKAAGTYTVTVAAGDTTYSISPTCTGQFVRSE